MGQVLGGRGRLCLHKDWRIFEIGEDYILVLVRGELDVETVQVWPLERS